jgi:hypothetical protein
MNENEDRNRENTFKQPVHYLKQNPTPANNQLQQLQSNMQNLNQIVHIK